MLLAAAVLLASAGVLHVLGVAGYRRGELTVALTLGGAGGITALIVIPREAAARWMVAAVAVIAGLVLAAPLAEHAPLSTGRIVALLDDARLPDFEVVATERSGHSWCLPDCPAVRRTYQAPDVALGAAVLIVLVQLSESGLVPPPAGADPRLPSELQVEGDDLDVDIRARRLEGGEVQVTVTVESER